MSKNVSTARKHGATEFLLGEAFQHAAVGMAVLDLDGTFLEVNETCCRILARTAGRLRRIKSMNLTHPEDRAANRKLLKSLLAGRSSGFVLEKRYLRPDKSSVWTRNSVTALRDDRGDPIRIIAICEDISGRRQAEETLRRTEPLAVVGRLASSIAHEINDPLEAVINLLYLARGTRSASETQIYLEMAEKEVNRVSEITKQNLLFHRQQSKPTTASLAELLNSILVLHRGRLARERIQVEVTVRESPGVLCFPGEIRQVFANLIGNAIDAMARKTASAEMRAAGRIVFRVRPGLLAQRPEQGVRVTIADTGHGIPPATLVRIFEPFFTTKGAEGTGLGLWVTSEIVARHGASLRVKSSTMPGRSGTVFSLTFPLAGVPVRQPASSAA